MRAWTLRWRTAWSTSTSTRLIGMPSTHSHDTQVRGNIKIFYTLIVDHGDLVSGLTADEVEDLIDAGVQDWAETGNTQDIPESKLPTPTASARGAPRGSSGTDATGTTRARLGWPGASTTSARRPLALIEGWAQVGNTALVPDAKIAGTIARDSEVTSAIATHTADTDAHHTPGMGGGTPLDIPGLPAAGSLDIVNAGQLAYYDPGQTRLESVTMAILRSYLHSSNNMYDALENRLRAEPTGFVTLTRDDANDRVDFKANIRVLTQNMYDAISSPDSNTLYLIRN